MKKIIVLTLLSAQLLSKNVFSTREKAAFDLDVQLEEFDIPHKKRALEDDIASNKNIEKTNSSKRQKTTNQKKEKIVSNSKNNQENKHEIKLDCLKKMLSSGNIEKFYDKKYKLFKLLKSSDVRLRKKKLFLKQIREARFYKNYSDFDEQILNSRNKEKFLKFFRKLFKESQGNSFGFAFKLHQDSLIQLANKIFVEETGLVGDAQQSQGVAGDEEGIQATEDREDEQDSLLSSQEIAESEDSLVSVEIDTDQEYQLRKLKKQLFDGKLEFFLNKKDDFFSLLRSKKVSKKVKIQVLKEIRVSRLYKTYKKINTKIELKERFLTFFQELEALSNEDHFDIRLKTYPETISKITDIVFSNSDLPEQLIVSDESDHTQEEKQLLELKEMFSEGDLYAFLQKKEDVISLLNSNDVRDEIKNNFLRRLKSKTSRTVFKKRNCVTVENKKEFLNFLYDLAKESDKNDSQFIFKSYENNLSEFVNQIFPIEDDIDYASIEYVSRMRADKTENLTIDVDKFDEKEYRLNFWTLMRGLYKGELEHFLNEKNQFFDFLKSSHFTYKSKKRVLSEIQSYEKYKIYKKLSNDVINSHNKKRFLKFFEELVILSDQKYFGINFKIKKEVFVPLLDKLFSDCNEKHQEPFENDSSLKSSTSVPLFDVDVHSMTIDPIPEDRGIAMVTNDSFADFPFNRQIEKNETQQSLEEFNRDEFIDNPTSSESLDTQFLTEPFNLESSHQNKEASICFNILTEPEITELNEKEELYYINNVILNLFPDLAYPDIDQDKDPLDNRTLLDIEKIESKYTFEYIASKTKSEVLTECYEEIKNIFFKTEEPEYAFICKNNNYINFFLKKIFLSELEKGVFLGAVTLDGIMMIEDMQSILQKVGHEFRL